MLCAFCKKEVLPEDVSVVKIGKNVFAKMHMIEGCFFSWEESEIENVKILISPPMFTKEKTLGK
jgi:hypothetical protein